MGSSLQEIFQGRGDKKGQGHWLGRLRRGAPPVCIVVTCFLLFAGLPSSRPALWFPLAAVSAGLAFLAYTIERRQIFAANVIFSLVVLYAGIVQGAGMPWLRLAFFPAAVAAAGLFPLPAVLAAFLLRALLILTWIGLPHIGIRTVPPPGLAEEAPFSLFLLLTAAASSLIITRFREERTKAVTSLSAIEERAKAITLDTRMESLSAEELSSHYFASVLKTDEEIRELLLALRKAVFADAATLFVPGGDGIALRCSTEEKGGIILSGRGVITRCLSEKKPFAAGDAAEKGVDIGYLKSGKITSIMALPLTDAATVIGVLAVDSSRYHAFGDAERETGTMFASHLVKILERERIYVQIKRDVFSAHVLSEESSGLLSSLDSGVIARKLCEGAERIVGARVCFFTAEADRFRLSHYAGEMPEETLFDLRGTFIHMGVENRQAMNISDVASYKIPILPFRAGEIRSVAVIPLIFENRILGLFVAYSGKKAFLNTFQMDMLKVMCNQASTSMANARLHAAIEKMATTDGLTGLYNHRVFQEKLTNELSRIGRTAQSVSLLLTDIDYFKKVNDTYGHPVGDQVLKGVAGIIRETIRNIDIGARYGGEEFGVILPGTDAEGALHIAERLRKAVAEKTFSADGRTLKVTISIGIATSPVDARAKEALIEKTDQALYHAKHSGRNRSVLSSETPRPS